MLPEKEREREEERKEEVKRERPKKGTQRTIEVEQQLQSCLILSLTM